MVTIIAAVAENNVIGKDGKLPWRLPEDMALFKEKTFGQVVIMGRKTWESIPVKFRPLEGRRNLVVSTTMKPTEGCQVHNSLQVAIDHSKTFYANKEIFLIGGSRIYNESLRLNLVDKLIISHVEGSYDGDTYFPEIAKEWNPATAESKVGFILIEYRKTPLVAGTIN